jgi:hypothetical protein
MQIYVVSLAKAGVTKMEAVPSEPETVSSDSAKYVKVPMDVVLRCYWRAVSASEGLPHSKALALARVQDLAERTEWIDRFQNSDRTPGEVIKQVFHERSASWGASAWGVYGESK